MVVDWDVEEDGVGDYGADEVAHNHVSTWKGREEIWWEDWTWVTVLEPDQNWHGDHEV